MRVLSSRLTFLTRYRTKFREFLGEAIREGRTMRQANRRRGPSGLVVALMGLWLLTGGMARATADEAAFSNRSLKGAYGEIASGTIAGDSAISVARFTFHGDGTCD